MTVIDAITDAWANYGPDLTDRFGNYIIAVSCRYFFKQLRQWSRTETTSRFSTSSAGRDTRPPPEKRR